MELFWYLVLLAILSIYVILDGYDFGAGIVHLFLAKDEKDKKAITNSIGPFWDANEVWLIAGGGIMFFAFPTLYAISFSGFYLPLILVLWLLIFRAIGLELRGQIHNKIWEAIWDKSFGIASLLLALFFGVALGNVVRGVNLGNVVDGNSTYDSNYFFLPLWNNTLSPISEELGIIDWFTILLGIIAVVSLTMHGANWIVFKTNSGLNDKLRKLVYKLNFVLIALVVVSLFLWQIVVPKPFTNFFIKPWLLAFPMICIVGIFGLFWVRTFKKDGTAFLFSSLFLLGGLSSSAASIFPKLLPSTNKIHPDLTIYNVSAHEYGLSVGLGWFAIAAVLVAVYFYIQYKVFSGKMDDVGYGEH